MLGEFAIVGRDFQATNSLALVVGKLATTRDQQLACHISKAMNEILILSPGMYILLEQKRLCITFLMQR